MLWKAGFSPQPCVLCNFLILKRTPRLIRCYQLLTSQYESDFKKRFIKRLLYQIIQHAVWAKQVHRKARWKNRLFICLSYIHYNSIPHPFVIQKAPCFLELSLYYDPNSSDSSAWIRRKKAFEMKKIRQFISGFYEGFKSFGYGISAIINTVLLFIVYIIGVGFSSLIAKIFGKHLLENKKPSRKLKSYWKKLDLKKNPIEEYFRQF